MENASKALLIAGAILLVIAIIGIGMAIFTQAEGIIGNTSKQMNVLEVQAHNSMFDSYMDKINVKGKQIKELCSKIANYNQTADKNYLVNVYYGVNEETTAADNILVYKDGDKKGLNTTTIASITANSNYEVTGIMDTNTGIYTKIFVNSAN